LKTKTNKATLLWQKYSARKGSGALSPRRARIARAPRREKIDRGLIIARDNSTCYLCGRRVAKKSLQIDHVYPLARGGSHTYDNLRVACAACNGRKNTLTLEEFSALYGPPRNAPGD
jgi:5-methylcytosine-specific restriction endonuclease McrA